jgi:hypothetical protein
VPYALLADAVVVVHGLYILFVAAGAFLVLRWGWLAWIQLPAAAWGALVELGGWWCPLTPLENRFRRLAGEAGYEDGFIETYLLPLIYPAEMTRAVQVALGIAVVAVNAGVYTWVLRRRAAA